MRVVIVLRYAGQQKSPTSRRDPLPGPPPLDSPKPSPFAPVSAIAVPGRTSAPFVGVRPRASSGACFTTGAGAVLADAFALLAGTVISGCFAAGARTASRFGFSSGGVCTCTGRPPIAVSPPVCGPDPPPPSEIVITIRGASGRGDNKPLGANSTPITSTPWSSSDTLTIR